MIMATKQKPLSICDPKKRSNIFRLLTIFGTSFNCTERKIIFMIEKDK
jgi:hypothetical protein